jgi:hypothetical protein
MFAIQIQHSDIRQMCRRLGCYRPVLLLLFPLKSAHVLVGTRAAFSYIWDVLQGTELVFPYPSIRSSIYPSTYLFTCTYLPTFPSIHPPIRPSVHRPIYLRAPTYLPTYPSIHPPVRPSILPPIDISMALQPFVGPRPLFQFLNLHTVGRNLWMGDQTVERLLPTHRKTQIRNKRT